MADVINSGVPTPIQIYGRAPNGQLQAVTTDGAGNISFAGAGGAPSFPVNSQTISYQTLAADFSSFKLITMNGASLTLTLLAVAPTAGQGIFVENLATTTLTIARNSLNIDGAASNITVPQNTGVMIVSDGANYFTNRGGTSSLALTPTATQTVQPPAGGTAITIFKAAGAATFWAVQDSSGNNLLVAVNSGSLPTDTLTVGSGLNFAEVSANAPNGAAAADIIYGDSTTHTFSHKSNNNGVMSFSGSWVNTNVTPVTVNANVSTAQNLMSASIPAGTLNRVGRSLRIWCAGVYSTPAASSTTITVAVTLGGVTLLTITTTALGALQATNDQFNLSGLLSVQTGGASGVFEPHATLAIDLGAGNTVADSVFADTNTAVSSAVDLTAAQTLQLKITFSAASGSNSATQRQMVLETVG